MSLRAPLFSCIPDETARVARAAFPKGNPYMRMYDELGPIYSNPLFAHLFPNNGQPSEDPARLALVLIMAFAEGLSDRQAADGVRSRIDWKFALALPLDDPGFDASVLSEFRTRLLDGQAERLLFDTLLNHLREHNLVKPGGRQRTDSTHVLAASTVLNRLECVGETLRHALDTLATVAPDWLRSWVPTVWFDRYGRRFEEYRLPPGKPERYALAEEIGTDGRQVLLAVDSADAPEWLRQVEAVQILRQVWVQQFYAASPPSRLQWRTAEDLPPAPLLISTPYDPDARYGKKRDTEWTGYKVHLTETCDDETPNVITDVLTTPATTSDFEVTSTIQTSLVERDLTPSEHIVDAGYVTADHLLTSQRDREIELLGPAAPDRSWQARSEDGFEAAQFVVDWEQQRVLCPQGEASVLWLRRQDRHGNSAIQIRFAKATCAKCPARARCVRSVTEPRILQLRERDHYEALQAARQRQETELFKTEYARRAGIEGTISQGVHLGDLRRSRYIGEAKTRLMHLLVAAAMNFIRVAAWLADVPRSRTRQSAFATLGGASI
ncbi:MAG TPA: IS1182 family transposase [Herpetosiphonaceae bacterium]|nr:IS1182 family transposase [Herpetosiphonaceae bacterium]